MKRTRAIKLGDDNVDVEIECSGPEPDVGIFCALEIWRTDGIELTDDELQRAQDQLGCPCNEWSEE